MLRQGALCCEETQTSQQPFPMARGHSWHSQSSELITQLPPLTVFYPVMALCNNICSDKMLTFELQQRLPEFSKRQNTVKSTF